MKMICMSTRSKTLWLLIVLSSSKIECFLNDDKNNQCRQWQDEFAKNQATVTADLPPDVQGKWASESCEVRPGPQFLLRRYQFFANNSFLLQQFYYIDESCDLPSHAITIWGRYNFTRISWVVPGAMEADYTVTRIDVIAYRSKVAESLIRRINRFCPNYIRSKWKPYKRYRVYSYIERENDSVNDVFEDYDCLNVLHQGLNELQLVRVQHRKALHHQQKPHPMRVELFLGAINSDPGRIVHYTPTSYQPPLLKIKSVGCHVCNLISKSHELSPPHLSTRVRLPVYLTGIWISSTCEVCAYGMFLHRFLQFDDHSRTWNGMYQYYRDPLCTSPMFSMEVRGKFREAGISDNFLGATDYNFVIQRLYITPHEESFVRNLNGHRGNVCGRSGSWEVNATQDVTWTGGCVGLKLRVPSTVYNVLKVDIDHYGNSLLYLGRVDAEFLPTTPSHRPTTYQPPLVQCRHLLDNHLNPLPHALYLTSGGPSRCASLWLLIVLMSFGCRIL